MAWMVPLLVRLERFNRKNKLRIVEIRWDKNSHPCGHVLRLHVMRCKRKVFAQMQSLWALKERRFSPLWRDGCPVPVRRKFQAEVLLAWLIHVEASLIRFVAWNWFDSTRVSRPCWVTLPSCQCPTSTIRPDCREWPTANNTTLRFQLVFPKFSWAQLAVNCWYLTSQNRHSSPLAATGPLPMWSIWHRSRSHRWQDL